MQPPSNGADALVATSIAVLGASMGEFASIFFGALGGSLWLLGKKPDTSRWEGALIVLRMLLTSFAFSSSLAWWLEKEYGLPSFWMLTPISFLIAAMGDRWVTLLDKVEQALSNLISSITTGGRQ